MSDVDNFAYSEVVKKHFLHPLNFLMGDESRYKYDAVGTVGNPICGDQMRMYLRIEDGKILDVKWKTYGCASAIASTSALSELVKGKTLEEALKVGPEEIAEFLGGLPKHKFHCSVLGHQALAAAVKDYEGKDEIVEPTTQQRIDFLISVSRGHLKSGDNSGKVLFWWYEKNGQPDIYYAVSKLPYAWASIARKMELGEDSKEEIVEKVTRYLSGRIQGIDARTQEEFDVWHQETVENIMKIIGGRAKFNNVGLAQKWVNMALKHLWVSHPEITKEYDRFCHIPIDNVVMRSFREGFAPGRLREMDCSFGTDKEIAAWSRDIEDYDKYLRFQKDFRERCQGVCPLVMEFYLWLRAGRFVK